MIGLYQWLRALSTEEERTVDVLRTVDDMMRVVPVTVAADGLGGSEAGGRPSTV